MKVSVVIPCYNVEKYIERCLDSIVSNDYDNVEILIVNDCSTDNTLELINAFIEQTTEADSGKLIKVLNLRKNVGLGKARDEGIAAASGEILMFIDSDDFIHPNCISTCVRLFEKYNPDFVEFGYKTTSSNQIEGIPENPKIELIEGNRNIVQKTDHISCNKAFRLDLVRKYNLRFEYRLFEDTHFTIEYGLLSNRAVFIESPFYNYYQNLSSLSHSFKSDYFKVIAERTNEVSDILIKYGFEDLSYDYNTISLRFFCRKLLEANRNNKYERPTGNSRFDLQVSKLMTNFENHYIRFVYFASKIIGLRQILRLTFNSVFRR